MKRLTLNAKLYATLALLWVSLSALLVIGLLANRATMLNEKRLDLQHQIESATAVIKSYQDRAAKQTMPVDDAKRATPHPLWQDRLHRRDGFRAGDPPAAGQTHF